MEKLCHNSEMFLKQEKIMSYFPRYGQIIDQFQNLSNHPIKIIFLISVPFKDNNLKTRRNLRGQIERRNLEINTDFLEAFKCVKESLDQLHNNVKGMSDSCKSMQVSFWNYL